MRSMSDDTHRSISLERLETGVYRARNVRGGEITVDSDGSSDFTPVELLLVALGACSAVSVDHTTARHAVPTGFTVRVDGEKVRDETGSIMQDLRITFDVRFPEGEEGDRAREILPRAVQISHDRACTVSRTVEAGVPVRTVITP